ALERAELRRGDRPPVAGAAAPVADRVAEIGRQRSDRGIPRIFHRRAFFAQERMSKLQDFADHFFSQSGKSRARTSGFARSAFTIIRAGRSSRRGGISPLSFSASDFTAS